MTDREKVIKTLTDALTAKENYPWAKAEMSFDFIEMLIELLEEQDAVEPVKKDMVEVTSRYEYDCPCGAPLLIGQPYCADCGKSVKW